MYIYFTYYGNVELFWGCFLLFMGVKFGIQNSFTCKMNDRYEVCAQAMEFKLFGYIEVVIGYGLSMYCM